MERRGIERLSPPLPPFQCCRRPRVASAENTVYFSDRHPLPTSANTTLKRGEWGETWTVSRAFGRPIAWSFHDQALFIFPTPDHLHLVISFYQVLVPTYIYTQMHVWFYTSGRLYIYLPVCLYIYVPTYLHINVCILYVNIYMHLYNLISIYICLDTTLIYLYVCMSIYGISRCLHLRPSHCEVTPGSSQGPGRKGVWFDPQILKPLQAPPRGSPGGSGSTLKFWNLSRRSAPKPGVRVRRSPGEILGDPGPGNPPPSTLGKCGNSRQRKILHNCPEYDPGNFKKLIEHSRGNGHGARVLGARGDGGVTASTA